ncbi:unnamed protein product [Musa acuminata subsp. malaccensis]|uniref:(wild Malaysian banana) hypothetical protein n=1 Tax=Musa acuminata subsp. malaccensis TaxID=214687 RepID=A0A804K942_MUSAM|nr:PREDICTED: WRKY transcription factor 22-like [Musa acuminata subsp. malaccensis]CAG1832283.1 unnamed protein product [Musa acuminata subsp. malaccensis]
MTDGDWDLGAVVRSCRSSGTTEAAAAARGNFFLQPPSAVPLDVEQQEAAAEGGEGGAFVGWPDLFRSRDGLQELEELYKPFFPKVQQQRPRGSPSCPSPAAVAGPHQPPPSRQSQRPPSQIPRSKRRKNQQKKVVCHVPTDGISSDVWAWRKYGQKPIKGSPYPRGYYRCSSSKGCLARKQVERSPADPAMFIITYTAEHNHPVPTHRNTLAGSTRHKFSSPASVSASASASAREDGGNPTSSPPSSSTAAGLSPTTPLTASMEDRNDGEDEELDEDEGMLLVEDMEVMGEQDLLFMGGEEEAGPAAPASSAEVAEFFGGNSGPGDRSFSPAVSA